MRRPGGRQASTSSDARRAGGHAGRNGALYDGIIEIRAARIFHQRNASRPPLLRGVRVEWSAAFKLRESRTMARSAIERGRLPARQHAQIGRPASELDESGFDEHD